MSSFFGNFANVLDAFLFDKTIVLVCQPGKFFVKISSLKSLEWRLVGCFHDYTSNLLAVMKVIICPTTRQYTLLYIDILIASA